MSKLLHEVVIELTRNGPVSSWVDRMGEMARKAGVAVEHIDWQGSPAEVAHRIVQQVHRSGRIDAFRTVLIRLELEARRGGG